MLVAYFDEVKYQKKRSPCYWLGAIVAPPELIQQLENQLNELSEKTFGTRISTRGTEFHASDILNGHEHFRGWEWNRRITLLKELVSIFGSAEGLGKIFVKMHVERMLSTDVEGVAFMYLTERIDAHMKRKNSRGLLIGDRESDTVSGVFAQSLSLYRNGGTKFEYGKQLNYLIDTVHFTHSHHSRMLQLADLYVWLLQLSAAGDMGKWHRLQILEHVKSINNCISANDYKVWPTADSRLKV